MQVWILEFRAQCKLSKKGLKTNCWGAHFGGFVHSFSVIQKRSLLSVPL